MQIKTVGVLGCGLMGSGIAQVSAASGYRTIVREVDDSFLQKGLARIRKFVEDGVSKGKVAPDVRDRTLGNLSGTTTFEALKTCDLIIEAIVENLEDKKQTYAALEPIIGGHAILSGGNVPLGGGTSVQKKYGIEDSADQVYLDHTNHANPQMRWSDRDLVRAWADENVATFEFLIENGVQFNDAKPGLFNGGSVPRLVVTKVYSDDLSETINGSPGSGLTRALEKSAKAKGRSR